MEEIFNELVSGRSWPFLAIILVVSIAILGKSADILVDIAVNLSLRYGVPTLIVGATIVSLGTTFPEVVVSVLAALQGKSDIALGNSVGSIICDTGLILGVACLVGPIPLNKKIVNRQGWIQVASGVLLVVACFPFSAPATAFTDGSFLSQNTGILFLVLLGAYLMISVKWARDAEPDESDGEEDNSEATLIALFKILFAFVALAISSQALIASATEVAHRLEIPDGVIAATLVAFGTSLPELVTSVVAVRKGFGEIAIGNIIGADILNVLLVSGAAAAVTPGGLKATPEFFTNYFPAMLAILFIFRLGIYFSKKELNRGFGVVLLGVYIIVTINSYH